MSIKYSNVTYPFTLSIAITNEEYRNNSCFRFINFQIQFQSFKI